jgi:pyridoxal phosphate enzyme (YggS family)
VDGAKEVRGRIARAAQGAGRNPDEIRIMVAAKYGDLETVKRIIDSGIAAVGENHVQNARRWKDYPAAIERHMIGHLQTNKAKEAVELFDSIDTIDSIRLAGIIDEKATKILPVMIEANISGEQQKSGIPTDGLMELAAFIMDSRHLKLSGIFTMAPVDGNEKIIENIFLKADRLAGELERLSGNRIERCYGMSDDFEIAVRCGATLLRLGRILFGGDYGHR